MDGGRIVSGRMLKEHAAAKIMGAVEDLDDEGQGPEGGQGAEGAAGQGGAAGGQAGPRGPPPGAANGGAAGAGPSAPAGVGAEDVGAYGREFEVSPDGWA